MLLAKEAGGEADKDTSGCIDAVVTVVEPPSVAGHRHKSRLSVAHAFAISFFSFLVNTSPHPLADYCSPLLTCIIMSKGGTAAYDSNPKYIFSQMQTLR